MTRRVLRLILWALAGIGAAVCAGGVVFVLGGVSARKEPGPVETALARRLRNAAIPRTVSAVRNPVPPTDAGFEEALEHFADHCAVCHGNDGSGDTEMGRNLYPRAPDMRQGGTQSLADGALFYIIENGVRLTGMPAWATGTPEGERESWQLVHFMRKLPTLSQSDLERMKEFNPKSAAAFRADEEERRFLSGAGEAPKPRPVHQHGGRK